MQREHVHAVLAARAAAATYLKDGVEGMDVGLNSKGLIRRERVERCVVRSDESGNGRLATRTSIAPCGDGLEEGRDLLAAAGSANTPR
jgi:hypothetical protein